MKGGLEGGCGAFRAIPPSLGAMFMLRSGCGAILDGPFLVLLVAGCSAAGFSAAGCSAAGCSASGCC